MNHYQLLEPKSKSIDLRGEKIVFSEGAEGELRKILSCGTIVCKMNKIYWHGAHTTHRNMYHLVWVPKYRKKILEGVVKERLEELFRTIAEVNEWEIQELNIQLDHVHIMIQIPPNITVATVVQRLKGASSHIIRKELPTIVKKYLWGKDFWADGYFCETSGSLSEDKLRMYIQNQSPGVRTS